jgi:SAM-dependent methyltransferase
VSCDVTGRNVRLRELLIGVEGLALLRHLYDGSDDGAERRVEELRRMLDDESLAAAELTREADPRTGYRSWSGSYDEPGNPIVALEEPAVRALVDPRPPGRALDAACGTGRHTRHLVARGHDVLGIDLTPEMLARAARNVPGARFAEADLREIPADAGAFDLVVCGLALSHLPDVRPGVAELRRVLAPGGRLVISVLHPFLAHLGWHAPFVDADGRRGFVREHAHKHAGYLAAFRDAGLIVRDCVEPELTSELVRDKRRAFRHVPEATERAYAGLPGVLVWELEAG